MMKEDYDEAMRQQQIQEEEKYKSSIQYQEQLERQLEEQVNFKIYFMHALYVCGYMHGYVFRYFTCILNRLGLSRLNLMKNW